MFSTPLCPQARSGISLDSSPTIALMSSSPITISFSALRANSSTYKFSYSHLMAYVHQDYKTQDWQEVNSFLLNSKPLYFIQPLAYLDECIKPQSPHETFCQLDFANFVMMRNTTLSQAPVYEMKEVKQILQSMSLYYSELKRASESLKKWIKFVNKKIKQNNSSVWLVIPTKKTFSSFAKECEDYFKSLIKDTYDPLNDSRFSFLYTTSCDVLQENLKYLEYICSFTTPSPLPYYLALFEVPLSHSSTLSSSNSHYPFEGVLCANFCGGYLTYTTDQFNSLTLPVNEKSLVAFVQVQNTKPVKIIANNPSPKTSYFFDYLNAKLESRNIQAFLPGADLKSTKMIKI